MKKFIIVILNIFVSSVLFSCLSTGNVQINPNEIDDKEIFAKKFCGMAGSWSSYDSNEKLTNLFFSSKGYKLRNVFITGGKTITENGKTEVLFEICGEEFGEAVRVYVTDFLTEKIISDPTIGERIDAAGYDEKYNGKYTVYIYGELEGNALFGYTAKAVLYDMEGIPSQEQIEADIAAEEAEKLAKEEAEQKAREEKNAKLNDLGKKLAGNYIYHGIEEDDLNSELFDSGSLEEGHAYFISTYIVYAGGEMGGAVTSLFGNPNYHFVKYDTQKVKGEVVSAGKTIFGNLPISVVVAGGKAPLYLPVILGVVE